MLKAICLVGVDGVGKTTLADAICNRTPEGNLMFFRGSIKDPINAAVRALTDIAVDSDPKVKAALVQGLTGMRTRRPITTRELQLGIGKLIDDYLGSWWLAEKWVKKNENNKVPTTVHVLDDVRTAEQALVFSKQPGCLLVYLDPRGRPGLVVQPHDLNLEIMTKSRFLCDTEVYPQNTEECVERILKLFKEKLNGN